uniref:Plus3 domain-containing protein n=1 Tax=Kalanchoe fedtschenkoi TaxID=63787 RepID=A0A7N0VI49_KALFE
MADLENLLLAAAGRTGGGSSGRNRNAIPPSRKRHNVHSDDGSDSKDEDSDDGPGYNKNRKPSGSQVPLKKRLDAGDRNGNRGSSDDGSGQDGDSGDESIGSDLYKDDDDRQQLAELTELERELILSERAEKMNDKKFPEKFKSKRESEKKNQSAKQTTPVSTSRGVRSSARSADRAAAKDDALNELRAKRLKQQDPEAHRKTREASRDGSAGKGFEPVKRKAFTSTSLSSSSQSDSDSDDDGSTGDGLGDSDDERMESKVPTFENIKQITIRRSKLAKWLMEPFFDDLVVGCFVRVGIGKSRAGPVYRLCIVRNVDASDPNRQYKLENKMTHKFLNCVWGNESSAARWQMAMVSDSPPTEEEYRQWLKEVERTGGRMPTKDDVNEKKEAIQKTNSYVYSAATVKQMLQEKKSASARPMNIAAEKDRLRRELVVAESRRDDAEVERIKLKLQKLEESRQPQVKDEKALRLAEMNKKNRAENFKNASLMKPVKTGLKAGEAGYDPFSRRWTKSTNYFSAKPAANGDAAAEVSGDVKSSAAVGGGFAATAAALEAAADAGKLIDTKAPVERGSEFNWLHNFELNISLAGLQKYGGPQGSAAGFMARKQKIEATIGRKVPENDGKRHALTLTVSDYKRRRGLL